MEPDLLAAYRRTEYRVSDGAYAFVMRVDEPSDALYACHAAFSVDCSTFLTAWNPRSEPTPTDANEAAMARLDHELAALGYFTLAGLGVDPTGVWAGEPSLLVLGLDQATGVALARRYGQNAILCAGADAVPRLVLA